MKCSILAILLAIAGFSSTAAAENTYFGGNFHLGTYSESGFPDLDPTGVRVKAGKYFAENIAIEGSIILGMTSGDATVEGIGVELELKNALSVFVKGDLPLSDAANIYGLLGFTKGKLEASVLGQTNSEDDSGLSYGFGAETRFSENLYLFGEYVIYISESDYDYTGLNVGLHKKF